MDGKLDGKKGIWPNVSVSPTFVKWVKPLATSDGEPRRDSRGRALFGAVLDLARGTKVHGADVGGFCVGILLDETRVDATGEVPVAAGSGKSGLVNVRFNPELTIETFRYEGGEKVIGLTDIDPWELATAVKEQREAWVADHASERRERAARSFTFDSSDVVHVSPAKGKGGQGAMRGPDGDPSYYVTLSLDGVEAGGRRLGGWRMRVICSERQVADLNEGKAVTKLAGGRDNRPMSNYAYKTVEAAGPDGAPRRSYERIEPPLDNMEFAAALDAALGRGHEGQAKAEAVRERAREAPEAAPAPPFTSVAEEVREADWARRRGEGQGR